MCYATFCRSTSFLLSLSLSPSLSFFYFIKHCFVCRPSDYIVPEDAGIETRTVSTSALAVRRSNHSARSRPRSAKSRHIRLDLVHIRLVLVNIRLDLVQYYHYYLPFSPTLSSSPSFLSPFHSHVPCLFLLTCFYYLLLSFLLPFLFPLFLLLFLFLEFLCFPILLFLSSYPQRTYI